VHRLFVFDAELAHANVIELESERGVAGRTRVWILVDPDQPRGTDRWSRSSPRQRQWSWEEEPVGLREPEHDRV